MHSKFRKLSASIVVIAASFGLAAPASAQVTREEIQRDRLEQQLRTEGQTVSVDGTIERAPCPLAGPQFADLKFTFTGAQFTGLDRINGAIVAPAYADLIGRELAVAAICDIRDRAATILRRAGYLAAVQVPVQEIDGVVRFDVVLARMSAVQVRGEAGPSGKLLQKYIDRLVDQPVVNIDDAERYLLLARDIPGLDVRLVLQPAPRETGAQAGDVVGIFNVARTPFYSDANIQNLGSKSVGRFGGLLRARFNGVTGLGDETTLSYYMTSEFKEQQVAQIGHEFRIGGEGLKFGGNLTFAKSTPDIAGPDVFKSDTFVASAYASYPFKRSQTSNVIGSVGVDLIDQDIEFTGLPLSKDRLRVAYVRVDFNKVDADSLRGVSGYSGFEPRFALAGSLEVRQGFDIFGATESCGVGFVNCTAAGVVPPSRLDGDATAFVVRAQGQLDYRPNPLLKFSLKPRVQFSPDPLLSYEQVSGGNYTAGRGFDPGAVIGDSGYGGQFEIAYGSQVPETPGGFAFQPYAFFDLMAVSTKNVAGDPQTISSVGGGVRATLGRLANLDIFGAVPLEKSPFQTQRDDVRLLMTLSIRLAPWNR
ncbi:ShlB/FhaC/HecB family hemolysin secretion/activation protein [Pontixanthobacter aestiaquae]|uniref:ShlB/FhaC/HecB family hemolysin secretion/activation protein n=1 Tax=Pontixanthobacter aestiaquae TaxID=1509367 RepID=A0A844Z9S6_9SPHN|nr:ShlB/FhaC/HecB family hemolysin secretion/activation protein [Pontixanthobacter aestiaquae]MDN3644927.1 ShlB/FhaC/HecB family hemolysin secretion/activation protein [Pontixanthobacter aestiaquae]MXO84072.1 ShlB/FhaC/HecB family hemolysin secretion/activation protein [Pontixanthobacter aestiaquae]